MCKLPAAIVTGYIWRKSDMITRSRENQRNSKKLIAVVKMRLDEMYCWLVSHEFALSLSLIHGQGVGGACHGPDRLQEGSHEFASCWSYQPIITLKMCILLTDKRTFMLRDKKHECTTEAAQVDMNTSGSTVQFSPVCLLLFQNKTHTDMIQTHEWPAAECERHCIGQ